MGWKDKLVYFEVKQFGMNFNVDRKGREILHTMTKQLCGYKMQSYFERKKLKGSNK